MIRIQSEQFKKKVMVPPSGITLDRAAVVVIGIDLRENRGGSPGIRCDLAYGVEDGQGKFQAFNYDDSATTVPVYVEPHQFENYRRNAARALSQALHGGDLLEALALWFEQELVATGRFGEGATVV